MKIPTSTILSLSAFVSFFRHAKNNFYVHLGLDRVIAFTVYLFNKMFPSF